MRRFPLAFLCAGLLWGQQRSSSVEQAWKLAANGQDDQAVSVLQERLKTDPRDVDAYLLLGSLLMDAGRGSDAIAQLTKAVKLRPQSAEAQNALGEAYNSVGNFKAAREPFQRAIAIKPLFGVAHMNLGEALLNGGDLTAAAQQLNRAIPLLGHSDDASSAYYLRAKVWTAQGNDEKAAEDLQKAVAIRPAFPQAWADLGQARKNLLDEAAATSALERAVQLAPEDPVARYRLGAAYLDAGKPDLALPHLQAAYRISPDNQSVLNALQRVYRQQGKMKEADEIKERLAVLLRQKDEQNQNALEAVQLNNEGAAFQKAGDMQSALTKYQAAVALAPANVPMLVNYAVALLRLGHWTEGLNELHAALQLDPANANIQEALKEALAQAPAETVPDWNRR